ncbi:MAG: sugar transferase [Tepidisphaeraceae bacterium]|jgi:lipopolysaccharide/colanic/teichoic acid biosynthesis glycosyltransferase
MVAQDSAAVRIADQPHMESELAPAWMALVPGRRGAVRARPRPIHRLKSLHSRRDIDAILHRECARCERNGHEFCLVVIRQADGGAARRLARLAKMLCRRARATDEIGWFEPRHLCVVLPDTPAEGALSFVRDFTESANHRGLSPICNVLGYRGQAHSDNERLSVAQIARGIDEAGQDVQAGLRGRILPMRPVSAGEVSNLLVRPLPWWKRMIDVLGGGAILAATLPVMAVVALAVKVSDRGPVLFRQRRAGLGGKPFTIYKFRTMIVDAEAKKRRLEHKSEQDGPAFKIKHDPRITRVGRFLRETSLDELPQLFNVLLGDMTLVGPRPLPLEESNRCATWHRRRLDVTPGLTCIWQVHGRSNVNFTEWIRMDRRYIRSRSLWQDLKLIVMTIPSVLLRRGR